MAWIWTNSDNPCCISHSLELQRSFDDSWNDKTLSLRQLHPKQNIGLSFAISVKMNTNIYFIMMLFLRF